MLAQVPDLNDFVAGIATILAPDGVVTIEFPHLARLIEDNQFDTIYHEHFSYFSLLTAQRSSPPTGSRSSTSRSCRPTAARCASTRQHADDGAQPVDRRASRELLAREAAAGFDALEALRARSRERVEETKRDLLEFLIGAAREGKRVVGYGAPGKGNTLLNYCGIRTDFLDYTVDRNPYKQAVPAGHAHPDPRAGADRARRDPDYILILPWNLEGGDRRPSSQYAREWGAQLRRPDPAGSRCCREGRALLRRPRAADGRGVGRASRSR